MKKKIMQIATGGDHTIIYFNDKTLAGAGHNGCGQLGLEHFNH